MSPDVALIAYYEEVTEIRNVTFSGSVSAQAQEGETITITITLPDNSTEVLTATTLADKTFSTVKAYPPGNYSAMFHIDEDSLYQAADAGPVAFTVGKDTRSLTVNVTVA